MFILFIHK